MARTRGSGRRTGWTRRWLRWTSAPRGKPPKVTRRTPSAWKPCCASSSTRPGGPRRAASAASTSPGCGPNSVASADHEIMEEHAERAQPPGVLDLLWTTVLVVISPRRQVVSSHRQNRPAAAKGPGSDRDAGVLAVPCRGGFVVEPYPALGEVAEAQRGAGRDGHRGAAGAVRPPPQWMGEGIPVVEITHHRHSPAGLIGGQGEGDADGAVTPGLGRLDHCSLHCGCSASLLRPAVPIVHTVTDGT